MIDLEIKNKKNCMGCYGCFNICPQECISMNVDSEGFWYPVVDYNKCIKCNQCVRSCPIINKAKVKNNPKAYACLNKNEEIRMVSSSGGIFTLLAEEVINNKGVVFGAAFEEDFSVSHILVMDKVDIYKLRGSKYLQSKIVDTYRQAKTVLDAGKQVLFSGTPCQISGLKSYLKKPYDKLFCVDIICHGVPSPKVWNRYVNYKQDYSESPIKEIDFRCKNKGWKRYSVSFLYENNKVSRNKLDKDLYMKAFLKDICLRPSCYDCKFKSLNRESDITLADFWGIQDIIPEMDDDKGTSLIFINSVNGQSMLENIKHKILYYEVDINESVVNNPSAIKSVDAHPNRSDFFKELEQIEFDELVKKYCSEKVTVRIQKKFKLYAYLILKKLKLLDIVRKILNRY